MPLFDVDRDARAARAKARLTALAVSAPEVEPRPEWLVDPHVTDAPSAAPPTLGEHSRRSLMPAALRGARADAGRRGVAVIGVVALIACAVAAWTAWSARPRPIPVAPVAAPSVTASPSAPLLVVAVSGLVRKPGLVRLPAGARVADAIAAAGGLAPGGAVGSLNLARKVADGELVTVGAAAGAGPPAATSSGPAHGALIDLNTATVADLDGLPGVGPVLAQRIVDYRTAHGSFRSVDQLREVGGIGESKFQQLKARVTV